MPHKGLLAVVAVVITMTAVAVLPAAARTKKEKQYRADTTSLAKKHKKQQRQLVGPPSLDGRTTGRSRTCWNDTFVYDGRGVPVGPYCH
jgi:hypothetical protein